MKLAFHWKRRDQDTGEASTPPRSLSPGFLFVRQPKARTPSPHRRTLPEEPVQLAPTGSAAFTAAAGSASSVDESTLRVLLMRQPAAPELGEFLAETARLDMVSGQRIHPGRVV